MPRLLFFLMLVAVLMLSHPSRSLAGTSNPRELGTIHWIRDLDAGLAESKRTRKPVLVLFQEIPGCATCVGFGQQVLSQPLIADAIESEFVPVAIYNNRGGSDGAVLARYGEPAWNNPVMRFLSADGRDVLPRRDGFYSPHEVVTRLIEALHAAHRDVPGYLEIARDETHLAGLQTAAFGMYCFWEGEAKLGRIEGVVATRASQRDGEAVEVLFDSSKVPYRELVKSASSLECASHVYARDDHQLEEARKVVGDRARLAAREGAAAPPSDQKHSLQRSPLRFLPLTPMQATRVNASLAAREDPMQWLSPRQRALATRIATALARTPNQLAGLVPPAEVENLAAYEAKLRARL